MKHGNERGYVLLSVLVIMILIMGFAMILIPKTLNTSLQVNKSEDNTISKDISEMGIQYANAYLQSLVNAAIQDTKDNPTTRKYPNITNQDTLFCLNLRERLNRAHTRERVFGTNSNYSFSMTYNGSYFLKSSNSLGYSINSTSTYDCTGFKGVKVPISSVGKVTGKVEKSIKAEFVIENKGEGGNGSGPGWAYVEPDPTTLTYDKIQETRVDLNGNISDTFPGTYFKDQVKVSGNGKIYIGGHAWFDGKTNPSMDLNGQNIIVAVSGDAYFTKGIDFKKSNYICIRGNGYLWNNTLRKWEQYEDVHTATACPPSEREKIVFTNDINQWAIIEGELNVIY
jgi:hypothetical protein